MPKPPIESIILRAIDEGLDVLGESPKKALLYHLEKGLGISWQNVSIDIERFEEALKLFFGPGYSYIYTIFRKNLQNFSGEKLEEFKSFSECVSYLQRKEQKNL
jgi:hypothetical protein